MNTEKIYNPIIKEPDITIEQALQREIVSRPEESQASYLWRMGDFILKKVGEKGGKFFRPVCIQEKDLPEDILNIIKNIIIEALKLQENVSNPLENKRIIELMGGVIGYHNISDLSDSDSFDKKTMRNGSFFTPQPKTRGETYWNTLFFPYNTKDTREFAKKILDNKTIVLFGGGRSRLKEELQKHNITSHKIINIDPFVENIEEGTDPVISLNVADENFIKKMREQGIESADEIWVKYSVPAYLKDPKEIYQFIQNIDRFLNFGGNARIWPIQVSEKRDKDWGWLERKNALIKSLENINETNKYKITLYNAGGFYNAAGFYGFILHKLP